jgi:hypothetical protein
MILRDGFWENDEAFDKTIKNPSPKRGHLPSMREVSLETKRFQRYAPFSKEKFLRKSISI